MKLLGLAFALLVGWSAVAQERLTADQYVSRLLHPDCVFPNLHHDPDFRYCGHHILGRDRETYRRPRDFRWNKEGGIVYAKLQGDLGGFDPPFRESVGDDGRSGGGLKAFETWVSLLVEASEFTPWVDVPSETAQVISLPWTTDLAGGVVYRVQWWLEIRGSLGSNIQGYAIHTPYLLATDSELSGQVWRMLSADLVLQALARFRGQVANGCEIGITSRLVTSGLPPNTVTTLDSRILKLVQLTLSADGTITGECIDRPHWWHRETIRPPWQSQESRGAGEARK